MSMIMTVDSSIYLLEFGEELRRYHASGDGFHVINVERLSEVHVRVEWMIRSKNNNNRHMNVYMYV